MSECFLRLLFDTRTALKQGQTAIKHRQQARLAEMVAYARANSPYYRDLYQNLPPDVMDPKHLPVTNKQMLMARFDDWTCDRAVTLEQARAFVNNPDLIGERLLGRYTLVTTSGTTGTRGIDRSFTVTSALALRMLSSWLTPKDVLRLLAGGGRMAMVNAMGGHFASAVAATRLRKEHNKRIEVLPVDMLLAKMVARLNQFSPTILTSYASMAALLASEQQAGRLHIKPALVVLSAEGLAAGEYDRIARAFKARVRDSYAATECPFLSYRCAHGWLHVNSDWVLLEPVDANYQFVPPGQQSHTVLISNLANRVQPILRYDLGDSILQRPDPCPCGNPLPAIRVQGRAADVLIFPTEHEAVHIVPLAFGTVIDRISGVERFQIVQSMPTRLSVRLKIAAGADADHVWQAVHTVLIRLLVANKLDHVTVERADEPPEQSLGGKFRTILPFN